MGINYDFLILTQNNRGYFIAEELAKKSYKVAYLDFSERTQWNSQDFSGPFLSHIKRNCDEVERKEFLDAFPWKSLDKGLCLFSEEGMIEVLSPIADHQLEGFSQDEDVTRLKANYNPALSATTKSLKENWLLHFFTGYNKCVLNGSAKSGYLKPSDVFGETYYLDENFSQRQKCRGYLKTLGIEVMESQSTEIRLEAEKFFIKNGNQDIFSANKVLCFLESSDLAKLDPEFSSKVFFEKPKPSAWEWKRFDLQWQSKLDISPLPSHFALLSHWDLPWLEDNFLILRRNEEDLQSWSLWVRLKRDGDSFKTELKKQIQEKLRGHLGAGKFVISESKPQEGLHLSLYPIYQAEPQILIRKQVNFFPMGFDRFPYFDLFDMYQAQKQFLNQLLRSPS